MKKFFSKIKNRLAFWFLLTALIPLLIGMTYSYIQQVHEVKQSTFSKLEAIRDLKIDRLNSWLDERAGDLRVTSQDFDLTNLENLIDKPEYSNHEIRTIEHAREILGHYKANFPDYQEIFIMHPRTGKIILSTDKSQEGKNKSQNELYSEAIKNKDLFFKDIYYSSDINKPAMAMSIPIFCRQHRGEHVVGILAVRINLDYSLYELLQNRTGLGETGETLIVNKNRYALNELRWYENAPLKLKIEANPAFLASKGKSGIINSKDYRGEKVLAAFGTIPFTNWGLVCKQDVKELNASLYRLLREYLILIMVSVFIIIIVSVLLGKTISKPIIKLKKITQKIESGNLSARCNVHSSDELGSLGNSIDKMADSIQAQILIQNQVSDISKSMIGKTNQTEFAKSLLNALIKITDSVMGAFYYLNENKETYDHLVSIGSNKKLMRSVSAVNAEGEFGTAISAGRIYQFKQVSQSTKFIYSAISGDIIPNEILTIPIVSDDKVIAMISLSSLKEYNEDDIESINISWYAINQSYDKLLKSEKTRQLAETLSKSNQKLAAQSEELTAQTNELNAQAEELKHNAAELQEQNQELEMQKEQVMQATKLKSEFLANVSHELRTPLNSVLALSELLLQSTGGKLDADEHNYLEIIFRNGKNLLHLINDILDLSKIEAGKLELAPSKFNLATFFDDISDLHKPLAKAKNLEFEIDYPDDIGLIESDEKRLGQILHNLVGNAIKFTDKGFVKITASHQNNTLVIQVEDSGIGIAKDKLELIFEEFRQVDGSSTRNFEGTGLGLTISSKLVKLLNGDLQVMSELDKGSIFTVILPLQWQGKRNSRFFDYKPFPQIIKSKNFGVDSKKDILLVEDNKAAIIQVSTLLKRNGFNVAACHNGKEALEYVKEHIPDGIILDLMMPEIDGFEVLEKIRNSDKTRYIPVLILTAKDLTKNDLNRLSANNVQQLVHKGDIDLKGLLSKINLMLDNTPEFHSDTIPDTSDPDTQSKRKLLFIHANDQNLVKDIKSKLTPELSVITTGDGLRGIQAVITEKPEIILVDIELTGMSGIEICLMLKNAPDTKDIPVIALMNNINTETKNELDEAGCNAVVCKDNIDNLLEVINKLV